MELAACRHWSRLTESFGDSGVVVAVTVNMAVEERTRSMLCGRGRRQVGPVILLRRWIALAVKGLSILSHPPQDHQSYCSSVCHKRSTAMLIVYVGCGRHCGLFHCHVVHVHGCLLLCIFYESESGIANSRSIFMNQYDTIVCEKKGFYIYLELATYKA